METNIKQNFALAAIGSLLIAGAFVLSSLNIITLY